jgi:hypothetical protein
MRRRRRMRLAVSRHHAQPQPPVVQLQRLRQPRPRPPSLRTHPQRQLKQPRSAAWRGASASQNVTADRTLGSGLEQAVRLVPSMRARLAVRGGVHTHSVERCEDAGAAAARPAKIGKLGACSSSTLSRTTSETATPTTTPKSVTRSHHSALPASSRYATPESIRRAASVNGLPVDRIREVRVLDPYFYA